MSWLLVYFPFPFWGKLTHFGLQPGARGPWSCYYSQGSKDAMSSCCHSCSGCCRRWLCPSRYLHLPRLSWYSHKYGHLLYVGYLCFRFCLFFFFFLEGRSRLFLSWLCWLYASKCFPYPVPQLPSYSSLKAVEGRFNNQKPNTLTLNI